MDRIGEVSEVTGTHGEGVFEWVIPDFSMLKTNSYYHSPVFRLSDSSWYMGISDIRRGVLESKRWIALWLIRDDHGAPKTITFTLGIKPGSRFAEATFTHTDCLKWDEGSGKKISVESQNITSNVLIWPGFPLTVICRINCDSPEERKLVSCAIQTEVPGSFSTLETKCITLLSDRMKNLLINGTDFDVKICVKGKEFSAHRNILSTRSPVFAMMLKHDTEENNTGTIRIEDCDPDSFDEFLLYLYSGRTENLTPSKAMQIYYPADKYDFPVLKELCVSFLKTSLSVTSICDVIILAAKHGEKELLEVATDYFARNVKEILVTVGWQRFMCQNPVEANELYIKSMDILLSKK